MVVMEVVLVALRSSAVAAGRVMKKKLRAFALKVQKRWQRVNGRGNGRKR